MRIFGWVRFAKLLPKVVLFVLSTFSCKAACLFMFFARRDAPPLVRFEAQSRDREMQHGNY